MDLLVNEKFKTYIEREGYVLQSVHICRGITPRAVLVNNKIVNYDSAELDLLQSFKLILG